MARSRRGAPLAPPDRGLDGPDVFRLVSPHGFIDEQGAHRFWQAGQEVRAADELSLLRERGADLQEG